MPDPPPLLSPPSPGGDFYFVKNTQFAVLCYNIYEQAYMDLLNRRNYENCQEDCVRISIDSINSVGM